MSDTLIVTFSNMAKKDQAIGNPPASFRSAVRKYYGFPVEGQLILHNRIEIIEIERQ